MKSRLASEISAGSEVTRIAEQETYSSAIQILLLGRAVKGPQGAAFHN